MVELSTLRVIHTEDKVIHTEGRVIHTEGRVIHNEGRVINTSNDNRDHGDDRTAAAADASCTPKQLLAAR